MWSGWSTVSGDVCTETCGFGVITKERFCNDPAPVDNTEGCYAIQMETKSEACFLAECAGNVFVIIKSVNNFWTSLVVQIVSGYKA